MSFKGFYQVVCENGHYSNIDCYDFSFTRWICPECGQKHLIARLVDQTNDEGDIANPELLIKTALSKKDKKDS